MTISCPNPPSLRPLGKAFEKMVNKYHKRSLIAISKRKLTIEKRPITRSKMAKNPGWFNPQETIRKRHAQTKTSTFKHAQAIERKVIVFAIYHNTNISPKGRNENQSRNRTFYNALSFFFDVTEALTFLARMAFTTRPKFRQVNNRGVATFRTPPIAGIPEFGVVTPEQIALAPTVRPIGKTV